MDGGKYVRQNWRLGASIGVTTIIRINDVHAIQLIAKRLVMCSLCHVRITASPPTTSMINSQGGMSIHRLLGQWRVLSVSILAGFNKHAVSKAMIYLAFDFPFRQLKVNKTIWYGAGAQSSRRAIIDLKLGFKIEYHDR